MWSVGGGELVANPRVEAVLLEVARRLLPLPVRAKTLVPQASQNDDGLDKLFGCTYRITLFFDDKYLLPLAVLVRELADIVAESSKGRR